MGFLDLVMGEPLVSTVSLPPSLEWTLTGRLYTRLLIPSTLPSHWFTLLSSFSRVWLFAPLWTLTLQAPLSMGFSGQEYWSGLLFSSPGDLSDTGIEFMYSVSPALAERFFITEPPGKPDLFISLPQILLFWFDFSKQTHGSKDYMQNSKLKMREKIKRYWSFSHSSQLIFIIYSIFFLFYFLMNLSSLHE